MDTEIDSYTRSKVSLRYKSKKLELDYLESILEFKKMQKLFIMSLTLLIYMLYSAFDFYMLSEKERIFALPFHISIILLWVSLISSFHYNKFQKLAENILYLMPVYAVSGTLLFTYLYHNSVYTIEIYVILFWSSVAIGYMFLESVFITIIIATCSAMVLYMFDIIEVKAYALHIFMMITASTLGLSAGYISELFSRKNYEKKIEIVRIKNKLKEQASRDYLTNLYNRRYFNEIAQEIIKVAKRENQDYSVIMLDIDKFKNINDRYGHSIGDNVIKLLASLLSKHTRESDIVSRFGGEEFAILLPFTDKNGAHKIAEELRVIIEQQEVKIKGVDSIQFTISLGVCSTSGKQDVEIKYLLDKNS